MSGGEEPVKPAARSIVEQHAQSVLLAVITAVVIYSGTFVVGAREDAVRVSAQITALTTEVSALRAEITIMRANYVARDDFRDHESRLRALESRGPRATP